MVDNVESYCEDGVWKTRWQRSTEPFASGGSRDRQIVQGATVAQWYGVDHVIKNPDGSIAERNSYRPPGSPVQVHRLGHRRNEPGTLSTSGTGVGRRGDG